MKLNIRKGFSLSELGIALVILLIISTIAVISYFSIIDNAKEVKIIEDSKNLQLALARQEMNLLDYSTEYNIGDLDKKIQDILAYHLEKGTNLKGVVFPNEVILDKEGNYILGELKTKKSDLDSNTALLHILNIDKVKAEDNTSNLNLEVRKLDNNKMNKLIQENLSGDWFIISDYQSSNLSNDKEENSQGGFIEEVVQLTEEEATQQGYTIIETVEQLKSINNDEESLGGKYILMNDLDLSKEENWEPIGNSSKRFYGELNGNGHIINNLTINMPSEQGLGLFGFIYNAIIENVGLDNVNIKGKAGVGSLVASSSYSVVSNNFSNGIVSGTDNVGGLIGNLNTENDIKNNYFIGDIFGDNSVGGLIGLDSNVKRSTISNNFTKGTVIGIDDVGGLIGRSYTNDIKNSFSIVKVIGNENVGGLIGNSFNGNVVMNSFSIGYVEGNKLVGGLIGHNYSSNLLNSFSDVDVVGKSNVGGLVGYNDTASDITNSYSSGNVIGELGVGGLVGWNMSHLSNIKNSYWDKDISGQVNSAVGEGKTTEEMFRRETYNGWDFKNIWIIDEGNDYPRLRWEKK